MSDPKALGLGSFSNRNIKLLERDLPRYGEIIRGEILPYEQAKLDAAKSISPQYYQMLSDLYSQYGPELAQTGYGIDKKITQQQLADTVANQAQYGSAMASQLYNLDKSFDPEYYATRAATSDKLGELLGSINLDNANPEAERLVNQETMRSGNITPSSMQTTANALSFGDQMQKRRNALGQAISAATQFLPQSRTGFSGASLGGGVSKASNIGTLQGMSQFGGVQMPGSDAQQAGSQMFQTNAAYQGQKAQIDSQRRDALDRMMQMNSGVAEVANAI